MEDLTRMYSEHQVGERWVWVDSRNRVSGTPSEFQISIEPVYNVIGARIGYSNVPGTMYSIDDENLLKVLVIASNDLTADHGAMARALFSRAATAETAYTMPATIYDEELEATHVFYETPFHIVRGDLGVLGTGEDPCVVVVGGDRTADHAAGVYSAARDETYVYGEFDPALYPTIAAPALALDLTYELPRGYMDSLYDFLAYVRHQAPPAGNKALNLNFIAARTGLPARRAQVKIYPHLFWSGLGSSGQKVLSEWERVYTMVEDNGEGSKVMGFSKAQMSTPVEFVSTANSENVVKHFATHDTLLQGDTMYPDGVADIIGERFIWLRCEELEPVTRFSVVTKEDGRRSGIGMFILSEPGKLGSYAIEFVGLVQERFAPLRKLDRLTFRFERANRKLYDFKGLDVGFVLKFSFYQPDFMAEITKTPLSLTAAFRKDGDRFDQGIRVRTDAPLAPLDENAVVATHNRILRAIIKDSRMAREAAASGLSSLANPANPGEPRGHDPGGRPAAPAYEVARRRPPADRDVYHNAPKKYT